MQKRFWKDLSRIELLIICVVTLGLFGLTMGNRANFRCLSRQSEAKYWLKQAYNAQMLYFDDYDTFGSLQDLEYHKRILLPDGFYTYKTIRSNQHEFEFRAIQKKSEQAISDTWAINHKGELTNIEPGC